MEIKPNSLYNMDCLEGMKFIPDGSIDMILCDLPYGITTCKWDTIIPFNLLWEQYERIIKDSGAIALFGSEPFSSTLRLSNIKNYRYDWYWHKNRPTGGATSNKQPMKCFETISMFYKIAPTYHPKMSSRTDVELKKLSKNSLTKCDSELYGLNGYTQIRENLKEKYPTNYLNIKTVFSRGSEKVKHPTQKPVELCEYLIKTYTNEGELVLDNCMGSGTTAVACINTNRNFIGFELDPGYCDIAGKRIQEVVPKM
jgi:site-specific DNA-methyltransferase (adenine-specific)